MLMDVTLPVCSLKALKHHPSIKLIDFPYCPVWRQISIKSESLLYPEILRTLVNSATAADGNPCSRANLAFLNPMDALFVNLFTSVTLRGSATANPACGPILPSSHCRRVLSALPERTHRPSGLKLADFTLLVCPSSVLTHLPVASSHSLNVLS
jgi:hypothetical protein